MIERLRQIAADYDKRSAHFGEFLEKPSNEFDARILCAAYAAVSMALNEIVSAITEEEEIPA